MKDFQEIRIRIETGKRDIQRSQELVIRAMFERYFAKDGYRGAVVTAAIQMLLVGILWFFKFPTWEILMGVIALGLTRALVKGLGFWASSPPPGPPAPDDLPAPPSP